MTDTITTDTITVPARRVLAVDGRGGPDDPAFGTAIASLFAARAALGDPADVPLEGTFSQADARGREDFDLDRPEGWVWTLAVPAPDGVDDAGALGVELRELTGATFLQVEYAGAHSDEGPTLTALYAAAGERALGPHTEVYLTDPSTTPPAENRTLLRVPIGG